MTYLSLLISDADGYPFYSRSIEEKFGKIDPSLLSGLISAISTMGKELFNEQVATISYGIKEQYRVTIISKEISNLNRTIFFIFITMDNADLHVIRDLSTKIFIETKFSLKEKDPNREMLKLKIDRLVNSYFNL